MRPYREAVNRHKAKPEPKKASLACATYGVTIEENAQNPLAANKTKNIFTNKWKIIDEMKYLW